LLTWENSTSDIYCHLTTLPSLPKPPIKVEIRGCPRHNAKAKDSKWVSERKPLEDLKGDDVNELILQSDDGTLLEGSQTNFYVIMDGVLYTAGEGVLEGTVRHLVLKVCKENDIPVSFHAPNLKDIMKWEAAMISSTSRLLLPIDEILVPREGMKMSRTDPAYKFDTTSNTLLLRIMQLVNHNIASMSEIVIE